MRVDVLVTHADQWHRTLNTDSKKVWHVWSENQEKYITACSRMCGSFGVTSCAWVFAVGRACTSDELKTTCAMPVGLLLSSYYFFFSRVCVLPFVWWRCEERERVSCFPNPSEWMLEDKCYLIIFFCFFVWWSVEVAERFVEACDELTRGGVLSPSRSESLC